MKLFPLNRSFTNSISDYLGYLDQKISALNAYVYQFNPNWRVLNEVPTYYTHEELVQKGIIAPGVFRKPDGTSSRCLILFASKLKNREGLINNFGGYEAVWVCYGDPDNLKDIWGYTSRGYYTIPVEALPEERDSEKWESDLYLSVGSSNFLAFSMNSMTPDVWLSLSTKSQTNTDINSNQLYLYSNYPRQISIVFSDGVADPSLTPNGKLQELPPSYYIFSIFSDEAGPEEGKSLLNKAEYQDRRYYLFVRTSRGGGYYTWTFGYNPDTKTQEGILNFQSQATDIVGLKYLLDSDFRQKRFYYEHTAWPQANEKRFQAFYVDASYQTIFQIKTLAGGVWSGNNLLNHEFVAEMGSDIESVFTTDTKKQSVKSFNKTSIPTYEVDFENGENIKLPVKIHIW